MQLLKKEVLRAWIGINHNVDCGLCGLVLFTSTRNSTSIIDFIGLYLIWHFDCQYLQTNLLNIKIFFVWFLFYIADLTCEETLMSFGILMVSLVFVWLSMEFVSPSLEEELCPLVNWFWLFGVVIVSLLAAITAVVVVSSPPPPWCLFTVGLLFKFSVAVKDVTYIGEFLIKPFSSSLDVVVWFN